MHTMIHIIETDVRSVQLSCRLSYGEFLESPLQNFHRRTISTASDVKMIGLSYVHHIFVQTDKCRVCIFTGWFSNTFYRM